MGTLAFDTRAFVKLKFRDSPTEMDSRLLPAFSPLSRG